METLQYELFFGLGVLLQLFFSISTKFEKSDIWKILCSLGIGLLITMQIIAKSKRAWTYEEALFFTIAFSSCSFGILLKQKLLAEIDEITLLCWNVIFWFVYSIHFGFWNYISLGLLIPSYISCAVIFFKVTLNTFFKAFLYSWFMSILAYVGIVYFKFQNILVFKEIHVGSSKIEMLFAGMVFFYIVIHIINILNLIPIPLSKRQTISQRIQEVKEHSQFLANRYVDTQYNPSISFTILILLFTLLYTNTTMHFTEEPTIITLCIIFIPSIGKKYQHYVSIQSSTITVPTINP